MADQLKSIEDGSEENKIVFPRSTSRKHLPQLGYNRPKEAAPVNFSIQDTGSSMKKKTFQLTRYTELKMPERGKTKQQIIS